MQIYLPFSKFVKVASILDTETLLRQRENAETLLYFILCKCGETKLEKSRKEEYKKVQENPIFHFWWNKGKPFGLALFKFLDAINFEAFNRQYEMKKIDWMKKAVLSSKRFHPGNPPTPKRITTGYRIILLSKNIKFYKDKFYITYIKHKETVEKLSRPSKERFRFAKFLGLQIL